MASSRKKTMVTMIAAAMAAAMVIGGGSFAYLQSQSNTVTNKFNTNIVEVSAGETDLKDDNTKDYDIIPGKSDPKDPFVTIKNTVPAYLFVTINDTTDGLVQYEVDTDSWKKLPGYEGVYYKVVEGSRDQAGNPVETKHYVLKGGENAVVSYDAALENKDMVNADGTLKDGYALAFVGFGIQQEPFYVAPQGTPGTEPGEVISPTDAEIAAAVEEGAVRAFEQSPVLVTSSDGLKETLESGRTAVLQDNIILKSNEFIQIPSGKTASIDLNGNSLSVTAEEERRSYLIDNKGTLIIDDTSADKSGIITSLVDNPDGKDSPTYASNTISNHGTLILNGGTIENHGEGYACYPVDCYSGSSFTMNGGNLIQNNEYTYALRMFLNSTTKDTVVTINGGTISGGYGLWIQYPNGNANMGTLTINGGEINARDGYALYAGAPGNWKRDASNVSVSITGGTINGTGAWLGTDTPFKSMSVTGGTFEGLGIHKNAGDGFVSGGTYRSIDLLKTTRDDESIIAEGYEIKDNGDGTYSVVKSE